MPAVRAKLKQVIFYIERAFPLHHRGHNMSPMVSICICTHNRSQSLQQTLNSFASQIDINSGRVELLVVDNNCTDRQPQWIEAFGGKLPIRKGIETRKGL